MTSLTEVLTYEIGFIYHHPEFQFFQDDIKYKINRVCYEIYMLQRIQNDIIYKHEIIGKTIIKKEGDLSDIINRLKEEVKLLIIQGEDSS